MSGGRAAWLKRIPCRRGVPPTPCKSLLRRLDPSVRSRWQLCRCRGDLETFSGGGLISSDEEFQRPVASRDVSSRVRSTLNEDMSSEPTTLPASCAALRRAGREIVREGVREIGSTEVDASQHSAASAVRRRLVFGPQLQRHCGQFRLRYEGGTSTGRRVEWQSRRGHNLGTIRDAKGGPHRKRRRFREGV